jgi:GAF domain-containing protein
MPRWQTRSLLGTALRRRRTVVGILLAGTRVVEPRFSDRARDLFGGMAQHVAIALNNVRLVAEPAPRQHAESLEEHRLRRSA